MHDDFTDQLDAYCESMRTKQIAVKLEQVIYQSAVETGLVGVATRLLSHAAQVRAELTETMQALLPAPEPESYPRFMESQQPEPPPQQNGYRPPWMDHYYEEVERLTRVPE